MNEKQKLALEQLISRTLTESEIQEIDPHLVNRRDDLIAEVISRNRTKNVDLFVSERGMIAKYPHGPIASDALLVKLEVFSETPNNSLASIVKRAIRFLRQSEGLNIGEPMTRFLIAQLVTAGVLTSEEGDGLNQMSRISDAISTNKVSDALNIAEKG